MDSYTLFDIKRISCVCEKTEKWQRKQINDTL